ncbi:MAG: cysteine desulfurase [Cyclobacteriaceae bacterium]
MNSYRSQFPVFDKYPELAYLDNAATTQRPQVVIDAITRFYSYENANIHRGIYDLSNQATVKYEAARTAVAKFLGADDPQNIAFTKGTTESVNIVAQSFLADRLHPGDNIVMSILEHHANFIPWQMLAKAKGAELRIIPIDEHGDLDLGVYNSLVDRRTKMVAVSHISNTLGTINDIAELIAVAHAKGAPVTIDAAQSASLYPLDSRMLDYDFLTFSGHKIFGPFGIGVLYVSDRFLPEMKPYNYGGGMIREVTVEETTFAKYPFNLEAGTGNVGGVIGLHAAIDYLSDMDRVAARSTLAELSEYTSEVLRSIPEVTIVKQPLQHSGIFSLTVKGIHPHDVASFLNKDGIAVRAGMHCTQPLLDSIGVPATVRVSLSIYNERSEIDRLKSSLMDLIKFWS